MNNPLKYAAEDETSGPQACVLKHYTTNHESLYSTITLYSTAHDCKLDFWLLETVTARTVATLDRLYISLSLSLKCLFLFYSVPLKGRLFINTERGT